MPMKIGAGPVSLALALVVSFGLRAEEVRVRAGGATELLEAKVRFHATAYYPGWISREAKGGWRPETDGSRLWRIPAKAYEDQTHPAFSGRTGWSVAADGTLDVSYSFKALREAKLLCLAVVGSLPYDIYAGGTMSVDGADRKIPAAFSSVCVHRGPAKTLAFADAKGVRRFALSFPKPVEILLQDNRQWTGDGFSLRLFLEPKGVDVGTGYEKSLDFTVKVDGNIRCETAAYRIVAGKEWIPMEEGFAVEPGSALDFSDIVGTGRPAGRHGRPVVRDGHFEFENLPGKPQRFYGVNFVGGANAPAVECAKPFAENLARLGYNAIRVHHHDQGLSGGKDGTLDARTMERFDALMAALIENGLYVTTDFYVSRKVPFRDCGIDRDGRIEEIGDFKRLVLFHDGAYRNFIRHARACLEHVNPHTGRRYADEPALGWISFINEGTLGAGDGDWFERRWEYVSPKWTAWLAAKRASDPAYAGIPETLPKRMGNLKEGDFRHKNAFWLFLADVERDFIRRVKRFLRDEVRCGALVTDMNYSRKTAAYEKLIADELDYMDDHFYVDHPHFLERKWKLPSELENGNTFMRRTCGAMYPTTRRILGKPFVITEYNYSGPGRYRGVGGIATGAMAALQDWDGLWRFAWSHGEAGVKGPKAMTYFDMSGDPLGLASERASMCLFLRRDVEPYANTFAWFVERAAADSLETKQVDVPTDWRPTGWWAKVGCFVGDTMPAGMTALGSAAKAGNPGKGPAKPADLLRPIVVDAATGSFRIETPRTAGGFAEGGTIRAGAVAAELDGPATVWASALDGRPIAASGHLLVTHLTDVQNSGITYADSSRRILLDWGKLPHLMRVGTAKLSIAVGDGAWRVFALSPSGKRRGEVPSAQADGHLRFTADVARDPDQATYLYELERK